MRVQGQSLLYHESCSSSSRIAVTGGCSVVKDEGQLAVAAALVADQLLLLRGQQVCCGW
jgi:hypothetical protein